MFSVHISIYEPINGPQRARAWGRHLTMQKKKKSPRLIIIRDSWCIDLRAVRSIVT